MRRSGMPGDWTGPREAARVPPMTETAAPRLTTLQTLIAFLERKALVMLALGFAAGLPNLLIFDTLSTWLRDGYNDVTLEVIAWFSLATLAYSLKFLWAPLVDRTSIPGLTALLGHRRSWMLVAQGFIIAGLVLVSLSDPGRNLGIAAILAVFVGFSSATQDIAIDAWRIEAVGEERAGILAAAYQWGYRISMIVAGAVPLILADNFSWPFAYGSMAALMAIGVLAVFAAPREAPRPAPKPVLPADMPVRPVPEAAEWALRLVVLLLGALLFGSGFTGNADLMFSLAGLTGDTLAGVKEFWRSRPWGTVTQVGVVAIGMVLVVFAALKVPGVSTRPGVYFARTYGDPIKDFFTRFGAPTAMLILAMVCSYRLSDFVLNLMNPFYIDLGFTKTQIAEVRKVYGVVMSMIGVFMAAWAISRFGLMKSLIFGALASPLTNLVFAWMATQGPDMTAFLIAMTVDNSTNGFAGTVFVAYLSSLTSAGFTASQYALFSSLYSLPGKLLSAQSGAIVEGCARAAAPGGWLHPVTVLFADLPAGTFVEGAAKSGVAPLELAAGYVAFFTYTCLVGVAAIILAIIIANRKAREPVDQAAEDEPSATPA
jgi:PAT family beta-lactamase induction signal transducer AmpG